MIAFNKNILFPSEVKIDFNFNSLLETIMVKEDTKVNSLLPLMDKSYISNMSGQDIYYYKFNSFEKRKVLYFALEVKNILTLLWDSRQQCIFYVKKKMYTPEKLQFWVLHTFLPLVLELERQYRILHVAAVEVGKYPILFSAFSFGGKSTLTEYFLKKGHKLLSDDTLGVEKRYDDYYAVPSYPFYRPFRKLETLGYYTENFEIEVKPIHVVYVLKKSVADTDEEVKIIELKGIEKFQALYHSSFIEFSFMKKERFEYFAEMVKYVPVYQVLYPHGLNRLPEIYDALILHTEKI